MQIRVTANLLEPIIFPATTFRTREIVDTTGQRSNASQSIISSRLTHFSLAQCPTLFNYAAKLLN
jgi:hypothetical protein